ncbi:hypothetical protein D9758_002160 [Tetrapyrgos nigripes]|uniref:Uncharacterized protein n=1 Tax=Tetrapyrgos nigripes TaxID=182062 RepID=A0A8H5LT81_9AGAR|nr:hypothetical protein D9758_002160 [Tetrapyrgos nigripes]
MSDERKTQTLFITVIAGAISSVAFGVSIFAMGILWLIPSARPDVPIRPKLKDKSRRRSAPPIMLYSERNMNVPSILENDSASSPSQLQNSPRRVYFLDSQIRPSSQRRYSDMSNFSSLQAEDTSMTFLAVQPDDDEISPRSSSSTLVHVIETPLLSSPQLETWQESIEFNSLSSSSGSRLGSTSSPRPSLSLTTHLTGKVKSSWSSKKSSSSQTGGDSGGETQSDDTTPSGSKPARRGPLGFTPPWLSSKKRAQTIDTASPPPTPPTPTKLSLSPDSDDIITSTSSPSYFVRTPSLNGRRRISAPVRARTNPYSFPYFAEPPVGARDGQNTPPSSEESVTKENLPVRKDVRIPEGPRIADERRQQNAEAQASLGHGRRSPPRRTASEIVPVRS